MNHLERMIQEASNGVEDSHVYDRHILVQSKRVRRKANKIFHQNLEYAIEEIGLIGYEKDRGEQQNLSFERYFISDPFQ